MTRLPALVLRGMVAAALIALAASVAQNVWAFVQAGSVVLPGGAIEVRRYPGPAPTATPGKSLRELRIECAKMPTEWGVDVCLQNTAPANTPVATPTIGSAQVPVRQPATATATPFPRQFPARQQ